jgi:hypothetical protein
VTVRIDIDALERLVFEQTGQHVALQGVSATVSGEVRRVQPCADHASLATGQTWHDNGVNVSPNGFRPDCAACVATEPIVEQVRFEE